MKSELYLCGKLIDMTDVISFPLNKTFENMSNPTDIINEWSKSIKIPVTKANNEILANAFRLDRTVLAKYGPQENIGRYLDPTKKIPFSLLNNGDLLIKGYAKLSLTDYSLKDKFYTINLYGELGDLFQKMLNFAASIDKCPKLENDENTGKSDIWSNEKHSKLNTYAVALDDNGFIIDDQIRKNIENNIDSSYKYTWYDARYLIDDHMSGDYVLNNRYISACWDNEPSKKAEDVDLSYAPTFYEISGGKYDHILTGEEFGKLTLKDQKEYLNFSKTYSYKRAKHDTNIIGFMPTHHGFPNDFDGTLIQHKEESPLTFTIAYSTIGQQNQRKEGGGYGLGDTPFLVSSSIEDIIEQKANEEGKKWNGADLVGDGLSEEQIGQFVSWQQKPYIYFNKLFQMFQYIFKRDKEEYGGMLFDGYELEIDDEWTKYDATNDKYINPYWYKLIYTFDFLFNRDSTSFVKENILGTAEPQKDGVKYNFIFDNELGNDIGWGNKGNRDDYTYYHTEVDIDSKDIKASDIAINHQTVTLNGYYWMVLPVVVANPGEGWGNNQIPDYIIGQGGHTPKEIFHIGKYNNVMFLLQANVEVDGEGVSTSMCAFRNYNFLYADNNLGDDWDYDLQFYQVAKDIIGDKINSAHSEMIIVDKWFKSDELNLLSNNKLISLREKYNDHTMVYILLGMPLNALGPINVGATNYKLKIKGGFTVEGYKDSYKGHDSTRAYATLSVSNSDDGYMFAYGDLWPTAQYLENIIRVPEYQNGFISFDIFTGQYASLKHTPDTNIRSDDNLQWISGYDFLQRMTTAYGTFEANVSCLDSKHNIPIRLKDIYDSENPLFNIILEYGKMYGLLWTVDYTNKKIRLQSRYTTFNGYNETVQDWSNKVDRTKDYQITPILHQSRYLNFDYEKEDDAYHYTDYGEKYSTQYGGYKLKTGYDFTPDSEDIFKGIHTTIFSNRPVITLEDIYKYTPARPCIAKMSPFCLMDCDSKDETSPISIQNWCFRNNNMSPFENEEKDEVKEYYIVDDLPLMAAQGKYSYLDIKNVGETFYKKITSFPSFNVVTGDYGCLFNKPMLDFTTPDKGETQSLLGKTSNDGFIYKKIWEKWMNERYNTNNKKLTCYINLTPSEYATFEFKNFKIIDGQLFMLNRIIDFNPNDSATTKCEFIQITDPDIYANKDQIEFTDFEVTLGGSYDPAIAEGYDEYYYKISPAYWGSNTTDLTDDYYEGDNYITVNVECTPATANWKLRTILRPYKENQLDSFGNEIPYGAGYNSIGNQGNKTLRIYTIPSFYPTVYDTYKSGNPWNYNARIIKSFAIEVKAESGETRVVYPYIYSRALEFTFDENTVSRMLDVGQDGFMDIEKVGFTNTPNLDIELAFSYSFYSILGNYVKSDGNGDVQNTYTHFIIPTNNKVVSIDTITETERQQGIVAFRGLPCYDGYYNILKNNIGSDIDYYLSNIKECLDMSERCTLVAFRLVDKTKKDIENVNYTSNEPLHGWIGTYYEVDDGKETYINPLFNSNYNDVENSTYDTSCVFKDPQNVVKYAKENAINFINRTAFEGLSPQNYITGKGKIGKSPIRYLHDKFWDYYERDGWAFMLFRQPIPTESTMDILYSINSREAKAEGDTLAVTTNIGFEEYTVGCPTFCKIIPDSKDPKAFCIEVEPNTSGFERTFDIVLSIPNSDIVKVISIHQYCTNK